MEGGIRSQLATAAAGSLAAQPPRLELLAGVIEGALDEFAALNEQVHGQLDRLMGPAPPQPSPPPGGRPNNAINEVPTSMVARLEHYVALLRARIRDLEFARERLKGL